MTNYKRVATSNKTNTFNMLKVLFTGSTDKELQEVSGIIDTYGSKFGVNTPLRIAHYLAQVSILIAINIEKTTIIR